MTSRVAWSWGQDTHSTRLTPIVQVLTLSHSQTSWSLSACHPEPSRVPSKTHHSEGRVFSFDFETKLKKNIRQPGYGRHLGGQGSSEREKQEFLKADGGSPCTRSECQAPKRSPRQRKQVCPPAPRRNVGEPAPPTRWPVLPTPYCEDMSARSLQAVPFWPQSGVPMIKTEPARRGARCASKPRHGLRGAGRAPAEATQWRQPARDFSAAQTFAWFPAVIRAHLHPAQSRRLGVQKDLPGGPRCHPSGPVTPGAGLRACQLLLDRELRSPSVHTRHAVSRIGVGNPGGKRPRGPRTRNTARPAGPTRPHTPSRSRQSSPARGRARMPLLGQNVPEACGKCLSFHGGSDSETEPTADAQRGGQRLVRKQAVGSVTGGCLHVASLRALGQGRAMSLAGECPARHSDCVGRQRLLLCVETLVFGCRKRDRGALTAPPTQNQPHIRGRDTKSHSRGLQSWLWVQQQMLSLKFSV